MLKNLQVFTKTMFSSFYTIDLKINLSGYRISNINRQIFRAYIIFIGNKNWINSIFKSIYFISQEQKKMLK